MLKFLMQSPDAKIGDLVSGPSSTEAIPGFVRMFGNDVTEELVAALCMKRDFPLYQIHKIVDRRFWRWHWRYIEIKHRFSGQTLRVDDECTSNWVLLRELIRFCREVIESMPVAA